MSAFGSITKDRKSSGPSVLTSVLGAWTLGNDASWPCQWNLREKKSKQLANDCPQNSTIEIHFTPSNVCQKKSVPSSLWGAIVTGMIADKKGWLSLNGLVLMQQSFGYNSSRHVKDFEGLCWKDGKFMVKTNCTCKDRPMAPTLDDMGCSPLQSCSADCSPCAVSSNRYPRVLTILPRFQSQSPRSKLATDLAQGMTVSGIWVQLDPTLGGQKNRSGLEDPVGTFSIWTETIRPMLRGSFHES